MPFHSSMFTKLNVSPSQQVTSITVTSATPEILLQDTSGGGDDWYIAVGAPSGNEDDIVFQQYVNDTTRTTRFQYISSTTTFQVINGDHEVLRSDTAAGAIFITLDNYNATAVSNGANIRAQFSDTSANNNLDGGTMGFQKEATWTSTASTRDSKFVVQTVLDGNLGNALSISSGKVASFFGNIQQDRSNSGAVNQLLINNQSNTASSGSELILELAGTSATGDAAVRFQVDAGGTTFKHGIDVSASGAFVLSASNTLGTSNVWSVSSSTQMLTWLKGNILTIANDNSTGTVNALTHSNSPIIRLTNAAPPTLNGITAGVDGQLLCIMPTVDGGVPVADESGSASAANRIKTGSGGALTIIGCTWFCYDGTSSRWRLFSGAF